MTVLSGAALAILSSALLFLISAIFFKIISSSKSKNQTQYVKKSGKSSLLPDMKEGIYYVRHEKILLLLTVSSVAGNFFTSMFLPFIVVYVTRLLSMGSVVFGIPNGLIAAGFGIGAIFAGRGKYSHRFPFYFTESWGLGEITILCLALSPQVITASLILFIWGLCAGFGDTVFSTGIQKFVPTRLLSRYWSIDETFSLASTPAGQTTGGILISSIGLSPVFVIASVGGSIH